VHAYRARISGPLVDRVDLSIEVPALAAGELDAEPAGALASAEVRARVAEARARQLARQGDVNARLGAGELKRHAAPGADGHALALRAVAQLALSVRAYHRILKVARTIADLAGCEAIATAHVAEALSYRRAG
jgi:magnesium chelatase family protein